MTVELKLNEDLKELLKIEGASDDSLTMVEGYFSGLAQAIAEYKEEPETSEQQTEQPSTMQMARKARIINPIKTEVSGSKLEMARNARIIK